MPLDVDDDEGIAKEENKSTGSPPMVCVALAGAATLGVPGAGDERERLPRLLSSANASKLMRSGGLLDGLRLGTGEIVSRALEAAAAHLNDLNTHVASISAALLQSPRLQASNRSRTLLMRSFISRSRSIVPTTTIRRYVPS